ncbi:MAG: nucleoside phosphorylase [Candidatus Eisenbacteria bacterium]|uniref:Uridine phosphorylase n=1 Tax=Eiseniibacteriota bacterium TaxID=2212470 RepID=A0A948RR23_UNCEI|nr:nucleoside phosphorylase [Candidatus Eisenbacteria bacterium]MBU1947094.1 nucleoside phosphorylase [Candidatus Eisenbacteria bacterium]MBU2689310.1 nucleoside phosphorylase [Candidatus Eisenbacteria bacterium]
MSAEYPILEFDDSRDAIIEPSKMLKPVDGMPEHCVMPIYDQVIKALKKTDLLTHIDDIRTSMGPMPVYRMTYEGKDVAVAHPGLGAPLAAAVFEALIAFGCRKFMACGAAGVLDSALAKDTVVVPSGAVRDEGTSYHYLTPGREIAVEPEVVKSLQTVLESRGVKYQIGKTWTTDAIFRETKKRIMKRRSEGCLTVEMECAAFLAVAAFRGVRFGQLLAAGDDVSGSEWDPRQMKERRSFPEQLFWLSVEACMKF